MLVPLLARVLDPRAGVAVCAAPLAGGPCRSVLMHAPAGGDAFRRASGGSASSGGGESSSAGRGRSADSEWSELLDCLRAYQADTADTPGTPGTAAAPDTPDTPGACFRVPTQFVVPSRAPYARRSWGDALGKRTSRLASQARQVKDVYADLAGLVEEQKVSVDTIEEDAIKAHTRTMSGVNQVTRALRHQRSRTCFMKCVAVFAVVMTLVIAVILIVMRNRD